jgi:hypothetical protein
MLTPFGPGLRTAEGPEVEVFGFRYPTRMALIRLSDGTLMAWSPVRLTPALRDAVEAFGPLARIVAPNALHHLSLGDWQAAFPAARLLAPPGLAAKRGDLRIDAQLGEAPDPAWAGEVDQVMIRTRITDEVVFFHRESATAIVTDLIQRVPAETLSGWRAVVARLDRMSGPEPQVPRKFRMAMTDRNAARAAVGRILDWPTQRLLIAHGAPVAVGGGAALRSAFGWLTG